MIAFKRSYLVYYQIPKVYKKCSEYKNFHRKHLQKTHLLRQSKELKILIFFMVN